VIILDMSLCMSSNGQMHIGRVLMYYSGDWGNLCRPHAWYQEPGYFSGFALLGLVGVYWLYKREILPLWRSVAGLTALMTIAAIFIATSRMGWLGLVVFVLTLAATSGRDWLKGKIRTSRAVVAAILLIFAVTAPVVVKHWDTINYHMGRGVLNPLKDHSFIYRSIRLWAGWQVFLENKWIGAGPGSAGPYFVEHVQDNAWKASLTLEYLDGIRHEPLSQNLYTELLSEWGIFGTICFFIGLATLLMSFKTRRDQLLVGLILAVIYTATQTLPRFDL
jgi:O-antigen ligase